MTLLERLEELKKENPFISIEDEDYDVLYCGRCRGIHTEPVTAPLAKVWKSFDEVFGDWKIVEEEISVRGIVTLVIEK